MQKIEIFNGRSRKNGNTSSLIEIIEQVVDKSNQQPFFQNTE